MRIIAASNVRAPIRRKLRWKQINWKKVEHKVKQLQMRIAKATIVVSSWVIPQRELL